MGYLFLLALLIILALTWSLKKKSTTINGQFEDYNISSQLQKLPDTFMSLSDVYIPKKNGRIAKIDHIVISHNGLFVIETKNNTGLIVGSENHPYWTQTINNRKENFYNPTWQNEVNIKALQECLGATLDEVPIHSIIVFGKNATLKFGQPFTKAIVTNKKKLHSAIEKDSIENFVYYTKRQSIKEALTPFLTKDQQKNTNRKPVIDIKQYNSERNSKLQMNVCPRCGSKLVIRKGKNGKFKACSFYPKCNFNLQRCQAPSKYW